MCLFTCEKVAEKGNLGAAFGLSSTVRNPRAWLLQPLLRLQTLRTWFS
jgi:hypothetical protein